MDGNDDDWFTLADFAFNSRVEPHQQIHCEDCKLAPTPTVIITLVPLGVCCHEGPYLCLTCLKKRVAGLEDSAQ